MIQNRQRFQRPRIAWWLAGGGLGTVVVVVSLIISGRFLSLYADIKPTVGLRAGDVRRLWEGGMSHIGMVSVSTPSSSQCSGTIGDWCQLWPERVVPWMPPPRGDKSCLWECNQVCDGIAGWCRCPAGWTGDACDKHMNRPCSQRYHEHGFEPYDEPLDWSISGINARCAGYCDRDIGMCYCPSNTKHGFIPAPLDAVPGTPPKQLGRPMALDCQPNRAPNGSKSAFGRVDPEKLTGPQGWCNADKPQHRCPCQIDGLAGEFCDSPTEHVCLNQCNGHGECRLGWCKCDEGWFGQDCAFRTTLANWTAGQQGDRPWLQPLVHTPAASDPKPGSTRTRPLIYVYELPPLYNQLMLSYRLSPGFCVPRIFDVKNITQLRVEAYNLEFGLHELISQSEHRTLDPEEADFFYIPVYTSCHAFPVSGYNDFPSFHGGHGVNRAQAASNMLVEAHSWLRSHYPYWDRRGGADHIVLATHDEASCYVPAALRPAILLAHWGYTGFNNVSFTAYGGDIFTNEYRHPVYQPEGHLSKLGNYVCYNATKDLVVPLMWPPQKYLASPMFGAPTQKRTIFAFHKGRTLADLPRYSRGTRQNLTKLAEKHQWWEKHGIYIGEGNPPGRQGSYSQLLASSTFCFVLMGDGWSARFDDAIVHGCIPVIIMDDVHVSFEPIFDVSSFSVRLSFKDIENVPSLLQAISNLEIESKQLALAKVWRRFFYSGYRPYRSVVAALLAERRNATAIAPLQSLPRPEVDYDPLVDDAFATILQWLNGRIPHTRGVALS